MQKATFFAKWKMEIIKSDPKMTWQHIGIKVNAHRELYEYEVRFSQLTNTVGVFHLITICQNAVSVIFNWCVSKCKNNPKHYTKISTTFMMGSSGNLKKPISALILGRSIILQNLKHSKSFKFKFHRFQWMMFRSCNSVCHY